MLLSFRKPELIAPAGSIEKLKTALAFGADAVYAGIPDYSLRARINEFNEGSLEEAIQYAHKQEKKVYVTLNIFAQNRHLYKLKKHIRVLKELGPDGLLISDPGVLQAVKQIWPRAKIMLSTQANCTNYESARFWYNQGIKRIILGREVSINEIKIIKMKLPKLEIECFVHGALCVAYSGRCFLSKFLSQRSANLGDCAQPCRWQYRALLHTDGRDEPLITEEDEHGSYILNSYDLCLIKRLKEMIKAGVSSFKIEGRAKSVHYLATVVGVYRQALNAVYTEPKTARKEIRYLYNELETKLNHRGYTEGFMFEQGKMAQNISHSHESCDWEFCGQVLRSKKLEVKSKEEKWRTLIKVHNSLKVGDRIEILKPIYDIMKMRVNRMWDSKTGEEIKEAHGGQGKVVVIKTSDDIPIYSVLRKKLFS